MGFFSEIKKGFKKVKKEISRPLKKQEQELRRIREDIIHEDERTWKNTTSALGFGTPKVPTIPDAKPPVERITGGGSDEIRRRQRGRVSGRKNTIVSGDLSPVKTGKKTLLGR